MKTDTELKLSHSYNVFISNVNYSLRNKSIIWLIITTNIQLVIH